MRCADLCELETGEGETPSKPSGFLKFPPVALPVSPTAKLKEFLELLSFGQSFPQW